jgi:hypothetical protein
LQRSRDTGCTNQHVGNAPIGHAYPIGRHGHLFRIGHVSPNPQCAAAILLNLDMRQVQFGSTSGDKSKARAQLRKSESKALSDPPRSARDEDALASELMCTIRHNTCSQLPLHWIDVLRPYPVALCPFNTYNCDMMAEGGFSIQVSVPSQFK